MSNIPSKQRFRKQTYPLLLNLKGMQKSSWWVLLAVALADGRAEGIALRHLMNIVHNDKGNSSSELELKAFDLFLGLSIKPTAN